MRSKREMHRNAKSRVYLATLTPEDRREKRVEILRRYSESSIDPLSEDDRERMHLIIRGLKDRGDLRCGFVLSETVDGKIRVVETFKTAEKRRTF